MTLRRRYKEYKLQAGRPYGDEHVTVHLIFHQNPTRQWNTTMVKLLVDKFVLDLMEEASEIRDDR